MVDWEKLRRVLRKHIPPAELIYAESCGSTNDLVQARFAEPDSPSILLASTDFQERGRGLHGRQWASPKDRDILFTLGIRPGALGYVADTRLPLCVGVILQRTIRAVTGINLRCKWPNDLVTNDGRKAGGILVINNSSYLAVGVGINTNSMPEDFPPELRKRVVTLREIVGHETDRTLMMLTIIPELLKHFTGEPGCGYQDLMKHWEHCAEGIGLPTLIKLEGRQETVTLVRINTETGELVVARKDGTELSLSSAQCIES